MIIPVETALFDIAVIDQFQKSTFSVPNTKNNTIKNCIDKFIDRFNLYGEQHTFWQPAGKSNVKLLVNSTDFGKLGSVLYRQIKCNIYIGEAALKKYGLSMCWLNEEFSDYSAPKKDKSVEHDSVVLSHTCLSTIRQQLSILEKSLNSAQSRATESSKVEGRKCVMISEDNPDLVEFFSHCKTDVQLEEFYEGYKVYEKLLQKFNGKKKELFSFLDENTPVPEIDSVKQIVSYEEPKEKKRETSAPKDQSLRVEVGHQDNSIHFTLCNNTNAIVPGDCTFEFFNSASEVFSIRMGPHELGIKGQKELCYFPSLPIPLVDYTIKVRNKAGDIIFTGKCDKSNEIALKTPLSTLSIGGIHILQDPCDIFHADAFSSFDESSVMSTPHTGEASDADDSAYTSSRSFTWEEI
ncbi:YOL083W [Saccharomyces arboricola H-6]|uniref:YOL083W n=1 Tax=Saccharomyces arboricola (strain H-6 / AS 2.3317 / CBS 10644) TaxID=1160507 RepID=J8PWV8_SACAR|nr:YOL083W [Saccharomyces arboricola H-6]